MKTATKMKKREAIAQAAGALFRAHGFEATTVDQVAAAAGVSRRTVFRYFASKDDLVFPHAEARVEAFRGLLVREAQEGRLEAVRRAARQMAEYFSERREELLLQQRLIEEVPALLARERDWDLRWEEALAGALGRGWEAEAKAGALIGAWRAVLRGWYAEEGREDLVGLVEGVVEVLAPMLEEAL